MVEIGGSDDDDNNLDFGDPGYVVSLSVSMSNLSFSSLDRRFACLLWISIALVICYPIFM